MNAQEQRRNELAAYLLSKKEAVSGSALSEIFKVSRQIIVKDIGILKEEGYSIISTHNGYVVQGSPLFERVFKVRHTTEQTEDELNTVVDLGGTVVDVYVWHKVYGKITAPLNISSRLHVAQFIEGVRSGKSLELMNITSGYHYHTIRAENDDVLDKIFDELKKRNYIVPEI